MGRRTLAEAIGTCESMGITIGPINNMQDIGIDPHYQARDSFIDVEDPSNGVMLRIPNVPFRLLGTPGRIRFPGLPLGSANRVIYRDLLGYSEDRIEKYQQSGVI